MYEVWDQGPGCKVQGLGVKVYCLEFGVNGFGLGLSGLSQDSWFVDHSKRFSTRRLMISCLCSEYCRRPMPL